MEDIVHKGAIHSGISAKECRAVSNDLSKILGKQDACRVQIEASSSKTERGTDAVGVERGMNDERKGSSTEPRETKTGRGWRGG